MRARARLAAVLALAATLGAGCSPAEEPHTRAEVRRAFAAVGVTLTLAKDFEAEERARARREGLPLGFLKPAAPDPAGPRVWYQSGGARYDILVYAASGKAASAQADYGTRPGIYRSRNVLVILYVDPVSASEVPRALAELER